MPDGDDDTKPREELLAEVRELRNQLAARGEERREQERRKRHARLLLQSQTLVELARSRIAHGADLDAALREITRAAAETLESERVSVWTYNAARSAIRCLTLYQRGSRLHEKGLELEAEKYPSYFEALERERTIAAHDAQGDPRTREFVSTYLIPLGITSMLDAPIRVGGRMIGVVCHEHVGPPRRWTDDEQLFAGSIADAVSLAIEESERKRAEEERARTLAREREARAEAETANRTKDEFLATVSHELRTPLNAMIGWVHLLRTGNLDAEAAARGLETIERNILAQAQIIDDILDVSRIVRGTLALHVRPVDLCAVLRQAIDSLSPAAQAKKIRIGTALPPGAALVTGDPDRLQQIAWNLLSNAVKFTPAGGQVEVRLERRGASVRLEISDTGQGISPEFLPHVFERFRQADGSTTRTHGGLGLGLSIVRHLVELHGGTVQAESVGEGRGSCFTVTLPAADTVPAPPQDGVPAPGRAAQPLEGLRLLVVDDDDDTLEAMAVFLRWAGAEVTTAASAGEAFAALAALTAAGRARPDLLIADIGMPGEDGYTLIRRVRALSPAEGGSIPAVALTAYARPEDREKALAAGFQEHVAKPVEPGDLVALLALLAGGAAERDGW
jgi:signal transduction histidine kinase/ActR/RegA family two-component response regulator